MLVMSALKSCSEKKVHGFQDADILSNSAKSKCTPNRHLKMVRFQNLIRTLLFNANLIYLRLTNASSLFSMVINWLNIWDQTVI